MNTRQLIEQLVNTDVEDGIHPVMIIDGDGKLYTPRSVEFEPGEEHEGNRGSGPTVWVRVEEF